MSTVNIGKARPNVKGEWNTETAYEFFDWVTYEGSSYLCINTEGAPKGTPLTNITYWTIIAKKR